MLKPIKLNPEFKEIIWGGNKLKTDYNKVSDLKNIAESWELTVRNDGMNTICGGEFDGLTMKEYIDKNGFSVVTDKKLDRFPLLIKFIIIPFMALHLMPVWIYLGGVIPAVLSYKNIYYAITNKALYISAGAFKQVFERRDLNDIANITMRKGFWDNILDLGDINITFKNSSEQYPLTRNGFPLHNIWEYIEVYKLLLETATKTSNDETNRQIQK